MAHMWGDKSWEAKLETRSVNRLPLPLAKELVVCFSSLKFLELVWKLAWVLLQLGVRPKPLTLVDLFEDLTQLVVVLLMPQLDRLL
mmetsp:Transcript_27915/g.50510  ORF Transcript_27915/g.50510 Transcript_27915/m.50510 type:complete len:86 (+) Transcript_27915:1626-1883(+)